MSLISTTLKSLTAMAAVGFLAGSALAGTPGQLTTTFVGGNGQSGNMFDLTATNNVTIVTLDGNYDVGTWNLEVYTCVGPYLPNVTTPGAWTMVASGPVTSTAANMPTATGLVLNIPIPAGTTTGFYVTVSNGTATNYTNGTSTGAVFASDANLTIYEGHGNAYPFGGNFNPRNWNGTIYYTSGGGAGAGSAYCFGDGTGAACPCSAFGAPGEGCANTTGLGAVMAGSGSASFGNDTLQMDITGVPGDKPGLILRGDSQIATPAGDGILCTTGATQRSHVQITSAGATSFTDFNGAPFGAVANAGGVATNFQFWYRDPSNTCSGGGFNFTNAWTVTYLP